MLQLPELSGNVLMEPILRLFDGDRDGYLTEAEVCRAVRKLGELQQEGADPCQGGISTCLSDLLHHCGGFLLPRPQSLPVTLHASESYLICAPAVIFQLYDTDGDGFITSDNVLALLQKTAGKALSNTQLQQASSQKAGLCDSVACALLTLHIRMAPGQAHCLTADSSAVGPMLCCIMSFSTCAAVSRKSDDDVKCCLSGCRLSTPQSRRMTRMAMVG